MDKQIIFSKPVRTWSDGLEQWVWYIQYACITRDGIGIDHNIISGETEAVARDKAQTIIKKYMETENEDV